MAGGSKRFWMIRNPRGGFEVPILDPSTVLIFLEAGWEIQDLPPAALIDDLVRYLAATAGNSPPDHI